MFRALTFFLFLFVSVFGQTQQVNSNAFPNLPFGTQNLKSSSVADRNPQDVQPAPPSNVGFQFFGVSESSPEFFMNDRWNAVGTYCLLFFSAVLNVFLILKVLNYRRKIGH